MLTTIPATDCTPSLRVVLSIVSCVLNLSYAVLLSGQHSPAAIAAFIQILQCPAVSHDWARGVGSK
jgi:hypothetical protein